MALESEGDTLESGGDTLESGGDTLESEGDTLESLGDTLESGCDTLESGCDTLESGCDTLEPKREGTLLLSKIWLRKVCSNSGASTSFEKSIEVERLKLDIYGQTAPRKWRDSTPHRSSFQLIHSDVSFTEAPCK
ncbi:hypothetical protein AVEN_34581-1 [Araneus ventricosus]|uniref:Uncharacterized protein n=1 Tax=Araneus ventricosus TaxID=182803 RepID=A0A4Y2B216_ARAVE|nr:hypothetical protein AVEN_34581-1 [Araneus ventricosus]